VPQYNHDISDPATGDPAGRPEEEQGWPAVTGIRRQRMGSVIMRAAALLLDMLTWWPEAVVAGQTCLAALQSWQGSERE